MESPLSRLRKLERVGAAAGPDLRPTEIVLYEEAPDGSSSARERWVLGDDGAYRMAEVPGPDPAAREDEC